MNSRLMVTWGLVAATVACVAAGCGVPEEVPAMETALQADRTHDDKAIQAGELDELTRAFADRYVGLLVSTCESLKKDNLDPVQRREAQELMLNCATNVYDIATNADSYTRVLDLVVVTTLVSQVWVDDDRAWEVFGDRGEVLVRALHHGRVEAWALAADVLRPEQLDLMDYLLWDWRRHNPGMVRVSFVRFSNFAIGRGKSANAEVLAAGGLLANVGQAGQAVAEARLLTERMFYLLKRYPALLRWQLEGTKDDLVATPEVSGYLADMHRLTDQVEQLPENVAAERRAILAAFDARSPQLHDLLVQVRGAIAEANPLVTSVGRTSESLNKMFKTADGLVARFDSPDKGAAAPPSQPSQPGQPTQPSPPSQPSGPPDTSESSTQTQSPHRFDIREYTQAVKELAVTAEKMNDLLKSSDGLVGSPHWDRRMEQVNASADGRMKMASEQSQLLVKEIFRGVYLSVGMLFTLLILYRVVTFLLARRLRIVADGTRGLKRKTSAGAAPEARTMASAGGKGVFR